MIKNRLTVEEASKYFKITYSAMYLRALNKKFGYPTMYYDKVGQPYFLKQECEFISQHEYAFFQNHIPLTVASYKIFGEKDFLPRYLRKGYNITLFNIQTFQGKCYVPKCEYEYFYTTICGRHNLIPLIQIKKHVGFDSPIKEQYFFHSDDFLLLRSFCIDTSRPYYVLSEINQWLESKGVEKIKR